MDNITGKHSMIITLDVDALLFDKLRQIVEADLEVVEINSVDPVILKSVLQQFPMLRVGAGNIIDVNQVEACHQAGVHFLTSPGFSPAIAQTASLYDITYLPGVATLSEAMHALSIGCQQVRPLPAQLPFCTLLNKYLPSLKLFPAEVEWEEIEHFLNLPAVAAVSMINPEKKQLQMISAVAFT